jgi:nucleoside 2-deoxyribosyltransferase
MKLYFASPLFNEDERAFNRIMAERFRDLGYDVYLPQEDSGEAAEGDNRFDIFKKDVAGLDSAEAVFVNLNGRVPDEGTVWECGYAFAKGKELFMYKTDARNFMDGHENAMLECCGRIYDSLDYLLAAMDSYYRRDTDGTQN